jgi:hypothetical protein
MRRLLAVLVAGVVCSLPSVAAGQVPTADSVTGRGTFTGGLEFRFDAHSGPSGENPTGTVTLGFFEPGAVTCLHVEGNIAFIQINTPTFQFPVTMKVTDGTPDRVDSAPASGQPGPCGGAAAVVVQQVATGDIVVTDAAPLPTSKDQCKNGGWRTYGVFKNQGDCVSFVATGGKNPPARSP